MAIDASARITLRGGSEALKALQGVTRGTGAASKEAQKAAKETERWQRMAIASHQQRMKEQAALTKETARSAAQQAKSAQQVAAAKEKAAQAAVAAAEREAKAIDRIQQRQVERWQRLAQKSTDVQMREDAKKVAAAQRLAAKQIDIAKRTAATELEARRKHNRELGGLIGTGTAAVLAGGVTAVSAARGASGAKSIQERIQSGNEFRERLMRVSSAAGMSGEEREALQASILTSSAKNGQDAGEMLGIVETGQGTFNDARGFAKNAEEIGRIAKTAGADMVALTEAIGHTNNAFGLTGDIAMETGYAIKSSADVGSTEVEKLATAFAPVAGTYALTTKQTGVKGRNQFLAMAQTLNTTGVGAEGAATRANQVLAAVSEKETQDKLKAIGVKGFIGKDGGIDLSSLIKQLEGNKKFQSANVRQDIFNELRGRQGIETLVAARRRVKSGDKTAIDLDTMTPDIAGAKTKVDAYMGDIEGEGWFQAQKENAEMQKATTENLGSFNSQIGFVTSAANTLEKAFGSLSLWAGAVGAMGITGIGGTLLKGALSGKDAPSMVEKLGGAASKAGGWLAGGAGSMLAAGGTAVGAASGAALAGAIGIGAGAGVGVGMLANATTSYLREDKQSASDLLAGLIFEAVNGGGARGRIGGTSTTRVDDGKGGQKEIVKVLERIDSGLRAVNQKPNAGAPRGPK